MRAIHDVVAPQQADGPPIIRTAENRRREPNRWGQTVTGWLARSSQAYDHNRTADSPGPSTHGPSASAR
eukprot:10760646-Alexandrium_andersonii.AAC.1